MDRLPPCQVTPTVIPPRRSAPLAVALLLAISPAAAPAQGPATLVKDIYPGTSRVGSNPNNIVSTFVGSRLPFAYFPATADEVGRELWRTGINAISAYPVKDINPGPASSNPDQVVVVNGFGRAFFVADDGVSGVELWLTDGSPTGTNMVQDIRAGSAGSAPDQLTRLAGGILFTADDGASGREVWFSDGTAAGTRLVADLYPGAAGSNPTQITVLGGVALFVAEDPIFGRELWRTMGVPNSTSLVEDFEPGAAGSSPQGLTAGATMWFFSAFTTTHGREPYRTTALLGGTRRLGDIKPGPADSSPRSFTPRGDNAWFVANAGAAGDLFWYDANGARRVLPRGATGDLDPSQLTLDAYNKLWFVATEQAYGTELYSAGVSGTTPFAERLDLLSGPSGSQPEKLTATLSHLFFSAYGGPALGQELYVAQGNTVTLVGDLHTGPSSSSCDDMAAVGNLLYFSATDGVAAREPWRSDGTAAGTFRLADLWPGAPASNPHGFAPYGACLGCAMFIAQNQAGYEVWRSAGAQGDPVMVKDIHPGAASSLPDEMTEFDGRLCFVGAIPLSSLRYPFPEYGGRELIVSDGTAAGTVAIDINGRVASSNPSELTTLGRSLLFAATDSNGDRELWAYMAPGVQRVANINSQSSSNPRSLVAMNGVLYFAAGGATPFFLPDDELWRSDGTEAGTWRVTDLVPGSSSPSDLVVMHGTLYFAALGPRGRELWRSDGTTAGTSMVKDISVSGSGHSSPAQLTVVGNTLFFVADDGVTGRELWRSDGTETGTTRVKDIELGAASSAPDQLLAAGGLLFFVANTSTSGRELWRSDGTETGTLQLEDLMPGPASSDPRAFADFNGVLLYAATYNQHVATYGTELRRSDGTVAGTRFVKDIALGIDPSFPLQNAWIHTVPGAARALLAVTDESKGVELWVTDGTLAGTRLHQDLAPGTLSSNPGRPARVGSTLFFAASDGTAIGVELWSMRSMAAAIPYGAGCAGTGGLIPRTGTRGGAPAVGNSGFTVTVSSARSNTFGVLLSCLSLARMPFAGCVLLVEPASLVLSLTAATDATGTGSTAFPIPANQGLLGLRLFQQWGIVDAGSVAGLAFSEGLELILSDG